MGKRQGVACTSSAAAVACSTATATAGGRSLTAASDIRALGSAPAVCEVKKHAHVTEKSGTLLALNHHAACIAQLH
eukprot:4008428-Pyramimonas_sp.AAC.1